MVTRAAEGSPLGLAFDSVLKAISLMIRVARPEPAKTRPVTEFRHARAAMLSEMTHNPRRLSQTHHRGPRFETGFEMIQIFGGNSPRLFGS